MESDWPDNVREKLQQLPARPGCYLFRDKQGRVLYVGKAKSLRSRVRSYFQASNSDERAFLPWLRTRIHDLETLVTATEKEAAILENSLIKQQQPKFNVKLRDDKEYLTLRLDAERPWPRLELVRRPEPDRARYFGPYHSATAARRTLHVVEKHFQLRTCSDRELESRTRPCLQHQIKRCPAPCVDRADSELYAEHVKAVGLFLAGKHQQLSAQLEGRMTEASRALEFERAATYRDQLAAVKSVQEKQRVVSVSDRDQDVLGLYREGDLVELALLYVRSGRVVEAATLSRARVEAPDDEIVAAYLRERYGEAPALIPDEILVPVLPEGATGVAEWLSEARGAHAQRLRGDSGERVSANKVQLICPQRGSRHKLLQLALENARHAFEEKRRASEALDERLQKLGDKLRLKAAPRRIECVDISHWAGQNTYGSVVVLQDGVPDPKRYKSYRVKTDTEGDDYQAMYEVLSRRFARGRDADSGDTWELPDLLVVDGGRGQLAMAVQAARDLGLHELQLAALAKERESVLGDKLVDRVYRPGQKNSLSLKPTSPELFLLARARDEAHRFANRARKRAHKRERLGSVIDGVPGVGPKTRNALLRHFGSLAQVRDAGAERWLAAGVTRPQAEALSRYFLEQAQLADLESGLALEPALSPEAAELCVDPGAPGSSTRAPSPNTPVPTA